MKKICCVIPLLLLASVPSGFAANKSNFTFSVAFGPHPVGFRVVHQYDYSRVYQPAFDLVGEPTTGERARPIQTMIWYPARPEKSAKPMRYERYVELLATEENFDGDRAQKAARLKAALKDRQMENRYGIERVQATHAFWKAKPATGKFPVVVYAPSLSAPASENSDLCEYLASHGYLVVASPCMGARRRNMTFDLAGIMAQVSDIEFLIGYLRNIPQADMSRIAVAGFSWGGISNVFTAMQDDRITALVCLDGSIRFNFEFLKEVKHVKPNRLTVPLLYLAKRNFSIEDFNRWMPYVDLSTSFLNDIKYSDFHFLRFRGMIHPDFASRFIRFPIDKQLTEYTPLEVSESHSWMARYVLHFLNAYLKNDKTSREFLKNSPEKNGVARHQLAMQFRPALRPAPNLAAFVRELAKRGFGKAIPFWQEVKAKDPGYRLPVNEVNMLGYQLLREKKLKMAISIFKLNVAMYPENFDPYDSLAEAQMKAGDKKSAIANYKKSLKLNCENTNAVKQLKKLGSKPAK